MSVLGYYLPGSLANSYVASKRDETGGYAYDNALNQIGIQEQAALQSLDKDYSQTINNAYNSYLSNKRGIMGSAMGQGYKEAYIENQRQQLMQNVAQANMNSANYKQQLINQADTARNQIGQQFQTEVMNIDKAVRSLSDFRNYLGSLQKAEFDENGQLQYAFDDKGNAIGYFNSDQKDLDTKYLYDFLYGADPKNFYDEKGNKGLNYDEWMEAQMDPESDFYRWFRGQGGFNEVKTQLLKQAEAENRLWSQQEAIIAQQKAEQEALKQQQKEEEIQQEIESHPVLEDSTRPWTENTEIGDYKYQLGTYKINDKEYKTGSVVNEELGNKLSNWYKENTGRDVERGTGNGSSLRIVYYEGSYYAYWTIGDNAHKWAKLDEKTQGTNKNESTENKNKYFGGGSGRGR